ncbi:MAG: alternative ribosome rescue aminoacyl-tRNA hydrolase ArfB [Solirubrobacteraceae bacterium]
MEPRDVLVIKRGVTIPLAEIEVRASRSSGPGGQHANSSDTRVEVSWEPHRSLALGEAARGLLVARLGERVSAVAQDTRSQARNRELALERLRVRIEQALHVRRARRPTKPGRAAKARRLDAKRRAGERKHGRGRISHDDD